MTNTPDRIAWLKGGYFHCNITPEQQARPHRLILLGAPGAGKGTQAALLSARLGACHLSTGDVFRAAKSLAECERTRTMVDALDYMCRGDLVPDETVLSLVAERSKCLVCGGGFLLDGFPRTVAQAEALDAILRKQNVSLEGVLSYELPLETIVGRLSGRRTCSACKSVYHTETRAPKNPGVCDQCGGALIQREDDRPESIRVRMKAYEESTLPLTNFYRAKGLLLSIPAEGTPEEILAATLQVLEVRNQLPEVMI